MKNFSVLLIATLICLSACTQPPAEKAPQEENTPMLDESLSALFKDIIVVKMHLFSAMENLDDEEAYPYAGTPIPAEHHSLLDEELLKHPDALWACYKTQDDFYIIRTAGPQVPNQLVLCRFDPASGKLKKIRDLSSAWCENDICHQQDAWLADLDLDQHLELIIRTRMLSYEGQSKEGDFQVFTQTGDGNFQPGKADLAVKETYVFHEWMEKG